MFIGIYIGLAILFMAIAGAIITRNFEKKNWNNGRCSICNQEWKSFDTDSQGGIGFNCGCKYRHIWISYKSVMNT